MGNLDDDTDNMKGDGRMKRVVISNVRSIKDFGALCDGINDDTAAFQAAIDWAEQNRVTKFE